MNTQLKNIGKLLLKIFFSALGLYIVYRQVDLHALAGLWENAKGWFFVGAMILYAISQFVSSFRLLLYFRNIALQLPVLFNQQLYMLGMFYNLFLPGGIGGDGYKIYILKKQTTATTKELFSAVFFDRLCGLWGLCTWVVILGAWLKMFSPYTLLALIGYGIATIVYYIVLRIFFRKHIARFVQGHLLALVVQGVQVLCAWLILRGLNHDGDPLPYMMIFLASGLATLFPFTIGGLGARELAIAWAAKTLSLDQNLSVSVSLCFYLIAGLVSLTGSFFLFKPPVIKPETTLL